MYISGMHSINESLTNLTWNDLRQWAGSKILNRGKSYLKNVYDLARTESGGLIARVSGSEDYATGVDSDENGKLEWFCSCPYDWGGPCKHAVALILAGLEQDKTGQKIPLVDKEGELFLAFWDDNDEDEEDSRDEDDFGEYEVESNKTATTGPGGKNPALIKTLEKKTKKE